MGFVGFRNVLHLGIRRGFGLIRFDLMRASLFLRSALASYIHCSYATSTSFVELPEAV